MASADRIAVLREEAQSKDFRRRTHMQRALHHVMHDRLTLLAIGVLLLLTLSAVFAPVITGTLGVNPETENLNNTYKLPGTLVNPGDPTDTRVHVLGTDDKGRDYLARLLYGGQISLAIAFSAAAISLTIGVSLGIYTGYYGGIVDDILIWFITTLNSIPTLFLLLIISSILSPTPVTFILILGLLGWTGTMRLVRGETFALREREYIIAARAMGASDIRVMFQHILPNLISIVVVTLALDIGALILTESALSYLSFGIAPPTPTWGNMLTDAQQFMSRQPPAPHLVIIPGLLIATTVLCLYLIGDGLRDALDPTAQER
ncbi:MAG: ABC transporter permease [Anaerolineae bacterium]|nr:ABC transporter permease [Anaerolineae bacterium]